MNAFMIGERVRVGKGKKIWRIIETSQTFLGTDLFTLESVDRPDVHTTVEPRRLVRA